MVYRVIVASREFLDILDLVEYLVIPDSLVQVFQDLVDLVVFLVIPDSAASQATRGSQEFLDILDLAEYLVIPASQELADILVPLVL